MSPHRLAVVYGVGVGKAADWLREERRKTLGDWVAFCLDCGYAQRYFDEWEQDIPTRCPACEGEIRSRCPECNARFSSAFAVDCEACGTALRPNQLFGGNIHK